ARRGRALPRGVGRAPLDRQRLRAARRAFGIAAADRLSGDTAVGRQTRRGEKRLFTRGKRLRPWPETDARAGDYRRPLEQRVTFAAVARSARPIASVGDTREEHPCRSGAAIHGRTRSPTETMGRADLVSAAPNARKAKRRRVRDRDKRNAA